MSSGVRSFSLPLAYQSWLVSPRPFSFSGCVRRLYRPRLHQPFTANEVRPPQLPVRRSHVSSRTVLAVNVGATHILSIRSSGEQGAHDEIDASPSSQLPSSPRATGSNRSAAAIAASVHLRCSLLAQTPRRSKFYLHEFCFRGIQIEEVLGIAKLPVSLRKIDCL